MFQPGDVISYMEMCHAEGFVLQQGMNFRPKGGTSVFLMSTRKGAPYADRVEDGGRVLIYEGHDQPRKQGTPDPKTIDQVPARPDGQLTQNGKFMRAAEEGKVGGSSEVIRVYEKIRDGLWTYNGSFELLDVWKEDVGQRKVFKFKLQLLDEPTASNRVSENLGHTRMIPSAVKQEVFKRDRGQCVECGAKDNLHFDHVIPYSRGGSSLVAENVQLLCARHNLRKRDRIQ